MPSISTIGETPRVLTPYRSSLLPETAQGTFQRGGRELPFYELSPETYQGLIGEQEFARRTGLEERKELYKKSYLQERNVPY